MIGFAFGPGGFDFNDSKNETGTCRCIHSECIVFRIIHSVTNAFQVLWQLSNSLPTARSARLGSAESACKAARHGFDVFIPSLSTGCGMASCLRCVEQNRFWCSTLCLQIFLAKIFPGTHQNIKTLSSGLPAVVLHFDCKPQQFGHELDGWCTKKE